MPSLPWINNDKWFIFDKLLIIQMTDRCIILYRAPVLELGKKQRRGWISWWYSSEKRWYLGRGISRSPLQGENWRGVGGFDPPGTVVDPLWKSAKMGARAGGSVFDNLQLNNSLTHSNFRYFTISGKNVELRPSLEKFGPSLEKMFNFYPESL